MLWLQRLKNWNAGSCWSNMLTIAQRVQNGIKLLDTAMPGWIDKVDVSTLNMRNPEFCLLGQITGRVGSSYWRSAEVFPPGSLSVFDQGFSLNASESLLYWEELTAEWKKAIRERKETNSGWETSQV